MMKKWEAKIRDSIESDRDQNVNGAEPQEGSCSMIVHVHYMRLEGQ